jgi:hypothetical protein
MYFLWVPYLPARTSGGRDAGMPKVLDPCADVADLRASLRDFDRVELVSAWELSGGRLRSERDLGRVLALVQLRGLILDELERRGPRRFQRLLRAGGPRR